MPTYNDIKPHNIYNPIERTPFTPDEQKIISSFLQKEGDSIDVRDILPRLKNYPKPIRISLEKKKISEIHAGDGRSFFAHSKDFGFMLMGELAKDKNRWRNIPKGTIIEDVIEKFYDVFEKSTPFILNAHLHMKYNNGEWECESNQENLNIPALIEKDGTSLNDLFDKPASLPFPYCSFETLHNNLISISSPNEMVTNAQCILLCETSPDLVDLFILSQEEKYTFSYIQNIPVRYDINTKHDKITKFWSWLIFMTMQYLNRCRNTVGIEAINKKIKIGTGKKKRFVKIKKIVRIVPTSKKEKTSAIIGKSIDWSHRWQVCGHWREIKGKIGKDRTGQIIKDWTWVSPYIKGPEDKPLIDRKIRVTESD